jgi:hypothetical protein
MSDFIFLNLKEAIFSDILLRQETIGAKQQKNKGQAVLKIT